MEAVPMTKSKTMRKRTPKRVLKLPNLEQSKSAVLNSPTSRSSQRTYDHAIREFIEWYCSELRLAFENDGGARRFPETDWGRTPPNGHGSANGIDRRRASLRARNARTQGGKNKGQVQLGDANVPSEFARYDRE
jgi:hypothetical protein